MNGKLRVAGIGLALSVMGGLVLLVVRPSLDPAHIRPLPLIAGAWLAFLAAAWLLRKVPKRTAVVLILLGGIGLQAVAVSVPRAYSNDLYRYMWDGRVQAAGIDPYQYVPTASQLTGLRNEFLFYPEAQYCVSPGYVSSHPAAELTAGCTRINRPTVPTIYPPVAEAYFLGVYYLHPADDSSLPIQAAAAAVAVLVTVLLLTGLGRLGRDVRMAALWSWCPTVVLEAGNSAHVDVVAVAITAAAVLALATARTTRRTILGGILLGLAIATKLTPVLAVPALLRRRWFTVAVAASGAFIAVYVPHVVRVGAKVVGFLPGYLQQENYTSGTRYGIIGLFIIGPLATVVALLILAATAAVAMLVTVLLLAGLGRLRRDVRMAALWAWCPTVILEAGNNAHVDVVAVAITAAAILVLATARTTRRTVAGGILLGLAIATKLTPVLTVPALLRRRWLTVALSAGGAFVAVYLPHVFLVGAKVIGFLPGYLHQENYTSGTRYGIIGLFIIGPLASVVAVLVMTAIALAVLQFSDPDRPWRGALYMTAGALAVTTPNYQWYALLLVMLVALDGRPEWLAFAAGGYYAAFPDLGAGYSVPGRVHDAVAYGVPLMIVGAGWLIRHQLASRAPMVAEPVATEPVVTGQVVTEPAAAETVPAAAEPVPAEAEAAAAEAVGQEVPA